MAHPELSLAQASRFWWQLGWVSFGGPAGQIALLHRELVERRRWLSERRYLHALNYCMLLPGPEAMQLATYLGWLLHGIPGGLIAGGLFVLPSVLVLTTLSTLYALWGQLPLLAAVFGVLKPAVLAIVLTAAWRLGRRVLRTPLQVLLAIKAFVALALLQLPYPVVVVAAALVGWAAGRWRPRWIAPDSPHGAAPAAAASGPEPLHGDATPTPEHARFSRPRLALTLLVWALALLLPLSALAAWGGWDGPLALMARFFTRVALLSFGGAYAVLPYVAQGAVEQFGWLTAGQMLDGLALGETTPGPLIMVVAFVGFMGGWQSPLLGGPGSWGGRRGRHPGDRVVHLPALLRVHPGGGATGGAQPRRPAHQRPPGRHHIRPGGGDRQPGGVLCGARAVGRRWPAAAPLGGVAARAGGPAALALGCAAVDRRGGAVGGAASAVGLVNWSAAAQPEYQLGRAS
jgi:chromate transporter